jgi:hypothetical protein
MYFYLETLDDHGAYDVVIIYPRMICLHHSKNRLAKPMYCLIV